VDGGGAVVADERQRERHHDGAAVDRDALEHAELGERAAELGFLDVRERGAHLGFVRQSDLPRLSGCERRAIRPLEWDPERDPGDFHYQRR